MRNSPGFIPTVDAILESLDKSPSLELGLNLCNEILKLMGYEIKNSGPDVIDKGLVQLPNAERYDSWFQPHPWMGGERAAFELNDLDTTPLQAKFYWLNKRSRQFIAGSVHFTENWEDSDYTHNDKFRAGIDFFLSPNGKSLQVVLSNRGNLRIVELHKRLNNTQVEIFAKWEGASQLTTQESLHNTLWESFKLKAVNEKFYAEIANNFTLLTQHLKTIDKDEEESKLFASRLLGRLLFCWFLRKKGIIDESMDYFNTDGLDSTEYYKQSLERLFFLTLNTPFDERDELNKNHQKELIHVPSEDKQSNFFKVDDRTPYLNGGLFEPRDNDWFRDETLTFPTGYFVNLYKHFDEFNFTTDESTPEYEQIAIDPEMLGRVFESLLATQIDETGQQARKSKGAFYTPREIVSYMCKESLRNYLFTANPEDERYKKAINDLLDTSDREWAGAGTNSKRDSVPKEYRTQIINALDTVTVLDPACGSGAFPMGMLQLCLRTYERLEGRFDPYKTKLQIIQNNIYGIDIEPMAVEIARLRAWLSLIVDEEDGREVEPLPNLDFKFACANSLVPLDNELGLFSDSNLHQNLKDIRNKYFNARKPHTKKTLQNEYYKLTQSEQTSLISDDKRTVQLKSFDPFTNAHPSDFFDPDQMFGLHDFNIVIGNPPYGAKYPKVLKSIFQKHYRVTETKAGYKGSLDTYVLFIELGFNLLSKNGNLHYIVPISITSSDSVSQTHKLLESKSKEIRVSSYSVRPKPIFDNAMVNTSILFFNKTDTPNEKIYSTKMYRRSSTIEISDIISSLKFQDVTNLKLKGRYPKISDDIEKDILYKLNAIPTKIRDLQSYEGAAIYYRFAGGRYFKVITNYTTNSSAERKMILKKKYSNLVGAVLSTSLYFWYYQVFSDNLNLKNFEVESFPVPIDKFSDDEIANINILYEDYLLDIQSKSKVRLTAKYANIDEFREYKIGKSFKKIDKLDNAIDSFFGLNQDEVNYIKNYDRGFRNDEDE